MKKFIEKIIKYAPNIELSVEELEKFVSSHSFENSYAGASKYLSAKFYDADYKFSGPEFIFEKGYVSIVDKLKNQLDSNELFLNTKITKIDYSQD